MSRSIRFLGLAVLAWAGVRAISLGVIPGSQALAFDARGDRPERAAPPIQPSLLPPIEPIEATATRGSSYAPPAIGHGAYPPPYPPYAGYPVYQPYPVYIPVPAFAPPSATRTGAEEAAASSGGHGIHLYNFAPTRAEETTKLAMAESAPTRQSTPSFNDKPSPKWRERFSISSWALLRESIGSDSLATGGMLGASQAGARVMWRFTPNFAASVRASAPVNSQRGAEGAVGLRYQPLADLPVAFTIERRHRFREYGRNGFAVFAEGGIDRRSLPWQTQLDGYFQAGVVDFNDPDWFVDGQVAVTRPVWNNLSAGFGAWGGAQPGLHRLDVGPRLSLRIGNRMRAHVDYRYMLTGNARPGSGAAVTLGGDF